MTEQEKRKSGGGKLSRSETETVRLDPKLRYLAELAASIHRRTLSSYVEWAIKDALDSESIRPSWLSGLDVSDHTIGLEAEYLWDVDDADRFAKLALRYPYLLTHEEQVLWKLIQENGLFWRGRYAGSSNEWTWKVEEGGLIFERLREHWDKFIAVAQGRADKSTLPTWQKSKPSKSGFEDLDDDIPF
jgi:hypothetical protein